MRIKDFRDRAAFAIAALLAASPSLADWHSGTVTQLGVGYDGSTITVVISGWSRNNCTCYPAWPNTACLNRSRASFSQEYAQLLSARRAGTTISINIDETSCSIISVYETE